MMTYRSYEERRGGLVKEHKGKIAREVGKHGAGRIWCPVTEGLVGLDDEHHLIGTLGETIVLP